MVLRRDQRLRLPPGRPAPDDVHADGSWPERAAVYTVYAIDAAGNRSASGNGVAFTTPPDTTAPSLAPVVRADVVHPARIHVSWTGSTDDSSSVLYRLFVDGSVYADQSPYTWAVVLNLAPSSTHTVQVAARDRSGNTALGEPLTVTTPPAREAIAPTAPTNVRLYFRSSTPEAWLEWDQSSDDTDPQHALLYEVYQDGVRDDQGAAIGAGSTISYCLEAGSGPTVFVVRAVDTSGNRSGPSNEVVLDC